MRPYMIRVSSIKGGVGKSVIATNLSVALKQEGYNVLLVDADFSNPCVGIYLGMESVNRGFQDVVKGKADPAEVIITHTPSGAKVLIQVITGEQMQMTEEEAGATNKLLRSLDYDFVIVDTQPGIQWSAALDSYDEALIVTLPTEASCVSAIRLLEHYRKANVKTSIVVNRFTNEEFDLSIDDIEKICEEKVISVLSEDDNVRVAVSQSTPVYMFNSGSPFSVGVRNLAALLASRIEQPSKPSNPTPQ